MAGESAIRRVHDVVIEWARHARDYRFQRVVFRYMYITCMTCLSSPKPCRYPSEQKFTAMYHEEANRAAAMAEEVCIGSVVRPHFRKEGARAISVKGQYLRKVFDIKRTVSEEGI